MKENPVSICILKGLFELCSDDKKLKKCLKEKYVKKLRKMETIQGIDFSNPLHILKCFVLLYVSGGLHEQLNLKLSNLKCMFGPKLVGILCKGIGKLFHS